MFFYVTLSVYPHRAGWKVSLTTVGIEPATLGILVIPILCQLSYEAKSVRVCGISELSLVPSIPMCSMIMTCTQSNIKNIIFT